MGSFTPHRGTHRFISVSERMTHPAHGHLPSTGAHNVPSPSHRGTTHPSHGLPHPTHVHIVFHLCLIEELHTHLMGFLTPHRGTQCSISVSERKKTPISWAQPTHGLSHGPIHLVCVLEDVSRICNHQHSLLAREAFSTRPSLSWKYLNFVLAVIINNHLIHLHDLD